MSTQTNTLLTISMVTREHLRVLENNLVLTKQIRRDFDDAFAVDGAKIGTTLNIRLPIRPVVNQGPALSIQNTVETSVPLVLNQQPVVSLGFTTTDRTLSIDDFAERIIQPSAAALANAIDLVVAQLYSQVYNLVGTPGTPPSTQAAALQLAMAARQRLNEEAAPDDSRRAMVIGPALEASMITNLAGLFNPQGEIAKQYEEGTMGRALGFKWSQTQNIVSLTSGLHGGAGKVNGASQTGSSLVTNGWTASITGLLKAGEVITIAGVNAVNPQSYLSTGSLRNFVVTADVNSDATGNATIPIYPAITPTSFTNGYNTVPGATVDSSPANAATITPLFGASVTGVQSLAFHKEFAALACADLVIPGGVDIAERVSDKQLGLSLRYIRAYDINADNFPVRVDVLFGAKAIYPQLAVRVNS